jgi:hypothetical protein
VGGGAGGALNRSFCIFLRLLLIGCALHKLSGPCSKLVTKIAEWLTQRISIRHDVSQTGGYEFLIVNTAVNQAQLGSQWVFPFIFTGQKVTHSTSAQFN